MLRTALEGAGFRIDHSDAGLYLWATRGEDAWTTVGALAERGILAAPGSFYGAAGAQHVRVALDRDRRADRGRPRSGCPDELGVRGVFRGTVRLG